jgi:hypothetical protein
VPQAQILARHDARRHAKLQQQRQHHTGQDEAIAACARRARSG